MSLIEGIQSQMQRLVEEVADLRRDVNDIRTQITTSGGSSVSSSKSSTPTSSSSTSSQTTTATKSTGGKN